MATVIRVLNPYWSNHAISRHGKSRYIEDKVQRRQIELSMEMKEDDWMGLFYAPKENKFIDGKCQKCGKVVAKATGDIFEMKSLEKEPGAVGFKWITYEPYPNDYHNRNDCYHFGCADHVKEMVAESFMVYGFRINPESPSIPYFVYFEIGILEFIYTNSAYDIFSRCMARLFRDYDNRAPYSVSRNDTTMYYLDDKDFRFPSWFEHNEREKTYSVNGIKRYCAGEWGGKDYHAIATRPCEFEAFVKKAVVRSFLGPGPDELMKREINKDKHIVAKIIEISKIKQNIFCVENSGSDIGWLSYSSDRKTEELNNIEFWKTRFEKKYPTKEIWDKIPKHELNGKSAEDYVTEQIESYISRIEMTRNELKEIKDRITKIEEEVKKRIDDVNRKLSVAMIEIRDMRKRDPSTFEDIPDKE